MLMNLPVLCCKVPGYDLLSVLRRH